MADHRLQVFHAVATHKSFTKAAEVLSLTQPSVTYQVLQLESHLNTRLFDRNNGGISLTKQGALVFDYAERILCLSSELDNRISELRGEISNSLVIGASMTMAEFFLPRFLVEVKAAFSYIRPRLVVANSESIRSLVANREMDVGFVESPLDQPDSDAITCCDDELMVICSPNFPLANAMEIEPSQLLDQPYVAREASSGTRKFTNTYLRKSGINPKDLNVVMEVGSPGSLKDVLETGLGYSIASHASVVMEQHLGKLIAIPLKPRLFRTLSMVLPTMKYRPLHVMAFIDFVRKRFSECHPRRDNIRSR